MMLNSFTSLYTREKKFYAVFQTMNDLISNSGRVGQEAELLSSDKKISMGSGWLIKPV